MTLTPDQRKEIDEYARKVIEHGFYCKRTMHPDYRALMLAMDGTTAYCPITALAMRNAELLAERDKSTATATATQPEPTHRFTDEVEAACDECGNALNYEGESAWADALNKLDKMTGLTSVYALSRRLGGVLEELHMANAERDEASADADALAMCVDTMDKAMSRRSLSNVGQAAVCLSLPQVQAALTRAAERSRK